MTDRCRGVEPLGLMPKAGTWHRAARSAGRSDLWPYRPVAIGTVQRRLNEAVDAPPHFDLAALWHDGTARSEAGVDTATATLRVSETGLVRLTRFSPAVVDAALASAAPNWPDRWVGVVVPIEPVDHAAREMLRLGPGAEVLAPPALRRALQQMAQRTAAICDAPA